MKALYALYSEPEAAQRALDSLRAAAAGSELKIDPRQIVVISGEPYEGYEFTDEHATGIPYRWAVLGAAVGGTCGLFSPRFRRSPIRFLLAACPLRPRGPTASSSTR